VKPLSLDLSIYERFGFENPPVGVAFVFDRPPELKRMERVPPSYSGADPDFDKKLFIKFGFDLGF